MLRASNLGCISFRPRSMNPNWRAPALRNEGTCSYCHKPCSASCSVWSAWTACWVPSNLPWSVATREPTGWLQKGELGAHQVEDNSDRGVALGSDLCCMQQCPVVLHTLIARHPATPSQQKGMVRNVSGQECGLKAIDHGLQSSCAGDAETHQYRTGPVPTSPSFKLRTRFAFTRASRDATASTGATAAFLEAPALLPPASALRFGAIPADVLLSLASNLQSGRSA